MRTRAVLLASALGALAAVENAGAQSAAVWAGANDSPNTLITGVFDGSLMTYLPEIPSGGISGGGPGWTESQVRVFPGKAQGRCSLLAQTNPTSNTVAIDTLAATGAATHVTGSPFATGGISSKVAWSRDGQALYVARGVTGAATVVTFRVSCTPGGPVSITNAGPVTLGTLTVVADLDVTASGSHLCAAGRDSSNVACFAIDPVTRLPAATPVNTVALPSVQGLRISGANGCGVVAVRSSNLVQGFAVSGAGVLSLTNTAAHVAPPFEGAVSPDGAFAAFGTDASTRRVALYNIAPATCQIGLAGTTALSSGLGAPYVAFDGANRLYVADVLANQIRVFQATTAGPGAAISTSTTNHATANPPIGIDAALLSTVPVELIGFRVE